MLILQRQEGESLRIGDEVEITVLSVEAGRARLALHHPLTEFERGGEAQVC